MRGAASSGTSRTSGVPFVEWEWVGELSERLDAAKPGERGELEMIARETLEALALGE